MKQLINRILIRAEEIIATQKIDATIATLQKIDHPNSLKLAHCLEQWRNNNSSADEIETLHAIVNRWNVLQQRNDIVEIDDFGAGSNGKKKQVNVGSIAVLNSRSKQWLPVMFRLVRELKPEKILELGTCLGVSGMYCASALRMNGKGSLITIEGAESYAQIAKENFTALQMNNVIQYTGRFSDVLDSVLKRHRPVDVVFIDGHHNGDATIRYFEQIYPSLTQSAWIIFDDISWSSGMKRAWKKITADQRVTFSADLSLIGICYLEQKE